MKNLSLVGIFALISTVFAASALADRVELIYSNDAKITICKKGMLGCRNHITVDGKTYLIDALEPAVQSYANLIGAMEFQKITESLEGKVTGFVVFEAGFSDGPGKAEVFKLLSARFPLPK